MSLPGGSQRLQVALRGRRWLSDAAFRRAVWPCGIRMWRSFDVQQSSGSQWAWEGPGLDWPASRPHFLPLSELKRPTNPNRRGSAQAGLTWEAPWKPEMPGPLRATQVPVSGGGTQASGGFWLPGDSEVRPGRKPPLRDCGAQGRSVWRYCFGHHVVGGLVTGEAFLCY